MKKLLPLIVFILFLALPAKTRELPKYVHTTDTRIERLQRFLLRYQSPMAPYAAVFIVVADHYKLDWRLLPAIAGAESTFGKNTPSCAPYNFGGYRSYTSPCGYWRFVDYREAIVIIARTIATGERYHEFQRTSEVRDLARVYTESVEHWTGTVNYFLSEIE